MNLAIVARQAIDRFAACPAIHDGTTTLSYAELLRAAEHLAGFVRCHSDSERPRVAALLPNRWEYVALDLACVLFGLVLVRCNARDTASDIAYVLDDAQPDVLLFDEAVAATAQDAAGLARIAPELLMLGPRGTTATERFVQALAPRVTDRGFLTSRSDDPYRVMYTSGSTGAPKGVVVTHDQWRAAVIEHLHIGPLSDLGRDAARCRFLHVTPLSHVSGGLFLPFALHGAQHVIAASAAPEAIAEDTARHACTHTFLVPTLIGRLLELGAGRDADLVSLERVYYAASPIPPARLRAAVERWGPIFAQGYGSTEAMWWLTYLTPRDHAEALEAGDDRRLASCGRASIGVPIALLNDHGQEVQVGDVGEVATTGRHVAHQYVRSAVPRIDEGRFRGWFRTGDLAVRDEDGFVYLMDRKGDLIITGGFNVYPREIENVMTQHPDVADCCVVGAPDDDLGETVTAFIVRHADGAVTEESIETWARERLSGYKLPRRLLWREQLPTTSAGKPDRRRLRDELWADRDRRI